MEFQPHRRESYGIKHEPIMVTPVESNRRPGQVVGFIGKQLCFFEKKGIQPQIGKPIEVMITRPLHGRLGPNDRGPEPTKMDDGSLRYGFDWNKLLAVLIQPVDPEEHLLVAIDGFECSGTMCKTTAHGCITTGERPLTLDEMYPPKLKNETTKEYALRTLNHSMWLTPGWSRVIVADNVNAGSTWKIPYKKHTPTNVYVERKIFEEKRGCGVRVAGLTRPEDCDYYRLFRK